MIHTNQLILIVAIFACIVVAISVARSTRSKYSDLDHDFYTSYCEGYEEGLRDADRMK